MLTLAQFELRTELNTANHLIYSSTNFAIILADRTDEKEKKIVL